MSGRGSLGWSIWVGVVVEDLEIVLREARDQTPLRVGDRREDRDDLRGRLERRLLREHADERRTRRRDRRRRRSPPVHESSL